MFCQEKYAFAMANRRAHISEGVSSIVKGRWEELQIRFDEDSFRCVDVYSDDVGAAMFDIHEPVIIHIKDKLDEKPQG